MSHEFVLPKEFEEFAALFKELSGIDVFNAKRNEDGWLFIPQEANLGAKDLNKKKKTRRRLEELAGPNGWKNNLVNDEYDGWWIRPPLD